MVVHLIGSRIFVLARRLAAAAAVNGSLIAK
jgi:hypothetical protein